MAEMINVIVPIYKAESFMDRCIQSIVDQTFKNLHIILVDDKSPDNSGEICEKWKNKDERITVIHHEVNKGAGAARNSGLEYIKKQDGYIAFVDADDFLHPRYFEYLYHTIQKENADIVWCSVNNTFEKKELAYYDVDFAHIKEHSLSGYDLLLREDLRIMYCMVWGKLYKSHIWENVRFAENYHYYEDGATTFKALYNAKKIVVSDAKLYNYFYSEDSATRSEISEIKLRDGLQTEIDKLEFYKEKKEPQLLEMAYIAYLNTLLKNIQKSRNRKELRTFRKEMIGLYRKSYMHGVRNKNLSKAKRMKYFIYRICPDIQRYYIQVKMKLFGKKYSV